MVVESWIESLFTSSATPRHLSTRCQRSERWNGSNSGTKEEKKDELGQTCDSLVVRMQITASAFCAGFVMDDDGKRLIACAPVLRSIFNRQKAQTLEEIQAVCQTHGWSMHIVRG